MQKEASIYTELKWENRNKVFNKIRAESSISRPQLAASLRLSLPTVIQNLEQLLEMGLIFENGSFGNTGGRRAKAYSICRKSRVSVGLDITRNHISVVLIDLCGEMIYKKRMQYRFSKEEEYKKKLGQLVNEALAEQKVEQKAVLGVGIAVPGLITEDHKRIFYGEILDFTDETAESLGKYISFPCRLYNDADAAGYAEISQNIDLTDAFYISLSNNVGGAILIDQKVYRGEGPRSGEVGHMTIVPEGRKCYCGQQGCFEAYCNAAVLTELSGGNLEQFFEKLEGQDEECERVWDEYQRYLSIAVNNVRMLFDCKIILGGYVGAYMERYLESFRKRVAGRNSFEENAEYLRVCKVKKEALALGSCLPFMHEFWKTV